MNITVIVSKALNKENWKKGVNYLNWLSIGGAFGLQNPVTIDLSFIQFTIGFWCKVSVCGVVFMIIFAFLSKKILDWLKI